MNAGSQALVSPVALCAMAITPFLLTRAIVPRLDLAATVAISGLGSILLNTAVPVLLHATGIPITATALGSVHLAALCLALLLVRRRRAAILPALPDHARPLAWIWSGGVLLLIPCTPLAGIDTYKWQDLATAVSVEQAVPWLVHPAALIGFSPRAYPSAQPLLLATVQTLTGAGVEAGYFLVSVFAFTVALASALCLGRNLFTPRTALWFAALYTFAPAAMRYLHWATGRGFMLAVLPLFVLAVLHIRTVRGASLLVAAALALALSHKAGLVAVVLLGIGLLTVPRLPPLPRLILAAVAAAATVVAAVGVGRIGLSGLVSTATLAASRFGILLTGLAAAIALREPPAAHRLVGRATTLLLLLFPIALTPDMYGALVVLPLVAIACASGFENLVLRCRIPGSTLAWAFGLLLAAGVLLVVIARDLKATPWRVRAAAVFLDSLDPSGPLQVHAPRHQGRIQAYLRGCPRFTVSRDGSASAGRRVALPSLRGRPREVIGRTTAWLRNLIDPPGFATDWYGANPRQYYVTIDGEGECPAGGRLVYDRRGVRIFALGAVPGGP